jgi:hypothetical protein
MNRTPAKAERLDVNLGQMVHERQPELQSDQLMGYPMIFQLLRGK